MADQHVSASPVRILFISRAWPPVIGGIERQNQAVATELGKITRLDVIANKYGKRALPLFLPYALLRVLVSLRKYDVVVLGDGVLGILGYVLKLVSAKPVASIVHGLDLTYANRIYQQLWIQIFLPRLDRLIAVGNDTIRKGIELGIPSDRFVFVPNGVTIPQTVPDYSREELEKFLGREIRGPVLLTLGRLVKRKGVTWFVNEVAPRLDENITYVIAGDGNDRADILDAIARKKLQDRVIFTGQVSEHDREMLLCTADLFIQPNIRVDGDVEGFGLVVLEAASYGLVVLASALEGLNDAIQQGENGYLLEAGNAESFHRMIESMLAEPANRIAFGQKARDYVSRQQAWPLIAGRYRILLEELVTGS